jgi:DNA-directed RNA polymerase specialized sigma24 family protein
MKTGTINASNDHSTYIKHVYENHYPKLQHYFLRQIGNTSEAHDCVQETICRFFIFMEGRQWEKEAEYMLVYLMRIASTLCLEKLAEKKSQCADNLDNENNSLFNNIKGEAIQSIKERLQLEQLFQRSKEAVS